MALDTHLDRASNRTGLASGAIPLEMSMVLSARFPPRLWRAHHCGSCIAAISALRARARTGCSLRRDIRDHIDLSPTGVGSHLAHCFCAVDNFSVRGQRNSCGGRFQQCCVASFLWLSPGYKKGEGVWTRSGVWRQSGRRGWLIVLVGVAVLLAGVLAFRRRASKANR
jgi:hypothetical protein